MFRTTDHTTLHKVSQKYPEYVSEDFDFQEWVSDDLNIALRDGENFAIFEHEGNGIYNGHYFFDKARGKTAIDLAEDMLIYLFENYPVEVVKGLVPMQNKAARWLSRQVGFLSLGAIETINGEGELFVISPHYRRTPHGLFK